MIKKPAPATRMTSVLLSADQKDLKNGEIVERIDRYIEALDVDVVVGRAVQAVIDEFLASGAWRPGAFTSDIQGLPRSDAEARPPNDSDLRKSIRIPVQLHDQVKEIAAQLDCTQGVIIRSALTEADLVHNMPRGAPSTDFPEDPEGVGRRASMLTVDAVEKGSKKILVKIPGLGKTPLSSIKKGFIPPS
jgi:hypothetical protein